MNFLNLEPGTLVIFNAGDSQRYYLVLGRPCKTYMCLDENGQNRLIFLRKEDEEFMTLLPPSQEP